MELRFEWNEENAKENLRKHRVSFEEAKTVFNDPLSRTFSDPDHSATEPRFVNRLVVETQSPGGSAHREK